MAEHMRYITVERDVTVAQLAEDVRKAQRPARAYLNGVSITLVPDEGMGEHRARRPKAAASATRAAEKYPTVASLAGAAGALPRPHAWDEVRETARDDHLAAKFGSPRS